MKKRALGAFLWVYVGWYVGSMLLELFGVTPLLGIVPGVAAAVIVLGPTQLIRSLDRLRATA